MPTTLQTLQDLFYGVFPHVYAKLFLHPEPHLLQMSWQVFCPLTHLCFVCCSHLGGTATAFALIPTPSPVRFPRIAPMVKSQTIDVKHLVQRCCCIAFRAEEKTRSTLSHTRRLTMFVDSLEYAL